MIIKAKFTTAGMTKNKLYDVIENTNDYYKIVLDDGTIALRSHCGFEVVKE